MDILEEKEKTFIEKILVGKKCNKCGSLFDEKNNGYSWNDLIHHFSISFGYGSFNYDCETWNFDICENCLSELVKSFIIPVNIESYF